MIRIILVTALLLISITNVYAESPTDKGVYSLGGSISYMNIDSDDGSDEDIFLFSPSGRYFIFDNIAIGVSLAYGKSSNDTADSDSYGIGPSLRYYLPEKTMNPFFEVAYSYNKNKSEIFGYTLKSTSNDYSIGFGLDYFLSRNVSIEPMVMYSWSNYKSKRVDSVIPSLDTDEKRLFVGIGVNWFIF